MRRNNRFRTLHPTRWVLALAAATIALGLSAGCGVDDDQVATGERADLIDIDETADIAETDEIDEISPPDRADDGEDILSSEMTDEGEPIPIDLDRLTASTWTLRFGGGPSGEVPLVDDWPITITFSADTFFGRAACNGYGGTYAITDNHRLSLGEISQTAMGCRDDVQESEGAFMEALNDVDGINLFDDGGSSQLALSGMATELIFVATEPAPVATLVDRQWLLDSMTDEGETFRPAGEPALLRVDADGTFQGSTGCRELTGRYVVSGNSIVFNEMAADGDCPTALNNQDALVVTVLGNGFVATIDADTLTATSVGGRALRYRAVSDDELAALASTAGADDLSDAALLDGTTWIFTGGDSPEGPITDPRTIDAAAEITLTFGRDGYTGTVVCNGYGGSADIGESLQTFTLGVPAAEEQGCGDELDDIAATYLDALPRMTQGGVEDDGQSLVLNGDDIELLFSRSG